MERVSSPEEESIEKSSATGVSTIYTGILQPLGVRLPLTSSPKGDGEPSAGATPPPPPLINFILNRAIHRHRVFNRQIGIHTFI